MGSHLLLQCNIRLTWLPQVGNETDVVIVLMQFTIPWKKVVNKKNGRERKKVLQKISMYVPKGIIRIHVHVHTCRPTLQRWSGKIGCWALTSEQRPHLPSLLSLFSIFSHFLFLFLTFSFPPHHTFSKPCLSFLSPLHICVHRYTCTYGHTHVHLHACIPTRPEMPLRLNLIIITLGALLILPEMLHCFNYSHYSQYLTHFLSCWQYLGSSSCSFTFALITTVLPCRGILNITAKHKSSSRQLLFPAIQIPSLPFSWALQSTCRLAPRLEWFQNVCLWFGSRLPWTAPTFLLPLLLSSSPVSFSPSQDDLPGPGQLSVTLVMNSTWFLRTLGKSLPSTLAHCSWNDMVTSAFLHQKASRVSDLYIFFKTMDLLTIGSYLGLLSLESCTSLYHFTYNFRGFLDSKSPFMHHPFRGTKVPGEVSWREPQSPWEGSAPISGSQSNRFIPRF